MNIELNKIYHMDCIDFLRLQRDNSVNLAVIDPPYNMQKAKWDKFDSHTEFLHFTYSWIDELISKINKNGSIYIFNTPFNCAYILQYLVTKGLVFQNWITWDKRDGIGSAKNKYSNGQESILFFTKSNNHVFNYEDIRIPYESTDRIKHAVNKGILKNGKRWYPNSNGKYCGEVWHIASERHQRKINGKTTALEHPTVKPLELIKRIIKASSNVKDIVLDCFCGSGMTAIACQHLERNFVCADNCADYVELSYRNLTNYGNY